MNGWLRYLELKVKSKVGLSSGVVVAGLLAGLSVAVAAGFFIFAAFIWLAEAYTPLHAALLLGGAFLLIAIIAGVTSIFCRRRAIERAQVALAARGNPILLDPKLLGVGIQIGRTIGWGRLISLAAVGILVAGVAREWLGRPQEGDAEGDPEDGGDQ